MNSNLPIYLVAQYYGRIQLRTRKIVRDRPATLRCPEVLPLIELFRTPSSLHRSNPANPRVPAMSDSPTAKNRTYRYDCGTFIICLFDTRTFTARNSLTASCRKEMPAIIASYELRSISVKTNTAAVCSPSNQPYKSIPSATSYIRRYMKRWI